LLLQSIQKVSPDTLVPDLPVAVPMNAAAVLPAVYTLKVHRCFSAGFKPRKERLDIGNPGNRRIICAVCATLVITTVFGKILLFK